MSCFMVKKKLLPSKKTIRSFTSLLKTKLRTTFSVVPLRRKGLDQMKRRAQAATRLNHLKFQSFASAHENEFLHHLPLVEALRMKIMEKSACNGAICDAEQVDIGEVDLRAELFIRRFKEEMKRQRQKSFEEYQEMLARGL